MTVGAHAVVIGAVVATDNDNDDNDDERNDQLYVTRRMLVAERE